MGRTQSLQGEGRYSNLKNILIGNNNIPNAYETKNQVAEFFVLYVEMLG